MEPKNTRNYEIGSTPVLLGVHRETIISIFFYSYSPEGPVPLFLNYTRMYHAGKPETCWGLQAPYIIVCPFGLCLCLLILSFLFGKWRRCSCDFMLWLVSQLFWEGETGTHWDALPGGVVQKGPHLTVTFRVALSLWDTGATR